jgi:predicted peptidase
MYRPSCTWRWRRRANWAGLSLLVWLSPALPGRADPDPLAATGHQMAIRAYEECALRVTENGRIRSVKYRLLVPQGAEIWSRFPLLVYLHGSGGRGDDNVAQLSTLPALMCHAEYRQKYACFVLAPQCPETEAWKDQLDDVVAIVEDLLRSRPIDPDRVYLTGFSMGGFGAWALATEWPDLFAAVVPVAGAGSEPLASRLTSVPIWAVHGGADAVVPASASQNMVQAIRDAGGNPKYTEIKGGDHSSSWKYAYAKDSDVLAWLFRQRKSWSIESSDALLWSLLSADVGIGSFLLIWLFRERRTKKPTGMSDLSRCNRQRDVE